MVDIEIKNEYGIFKLRVCGIIIDDDKVLVEEHQKEEMYALPGGHVEFGELTSDTVIREIKEELQIDTVIDRLFCINENIFKYKDKIIHEIGYYYILKPISDYSKENFQTEEIDKGKHKTHSFAWIPLKDITKYPLFPKEVIEKLCNDPNSSNNIIAYNALAK